MSSLVKGLQNGLCKVLCGLLAWSWFRTVRPQIVSCSGLPGGVRMGLQCCQRMLGKQELRNYKWGDIGVERKRRLHRKPEEKMKKTGFIG